MGDFRADIDLKMTMFGKTYKTNMWINYWDNGDGFTPSRCFSNFKDTK